MYRYEGTAAYNEYMRRMISSALWSGVAVVFMYNIFIALKKRKLILIEDIQSKR
jgi:hypothetical protein